MVSEHAQAGHPAKGHSRTVFRLLLLLMFAAIGAFGWLYAASPADALNAYMHGGTRCADCHHLEPVSSYGECLDCHGSAQVPNTVCINCHPGKTTSGATCWNATCHLPGQPMPPPTTENCIACHGTNPHYFSFLNDQPSCTVCHSTDPTPHHDGVDQVAPTSCSDCHTTETHDGLACTNCHATDRHPSYPPVPSTCFKCHPDSTFGGQSSCLTCHTGAPNFGGVGDNDLHDSTLPDAPISGNETALGSGVCTSCHAGFERHAGQIPCTTCHSQATPYHHVRSSTPGFKPCQDCHSVPQHGNGLPCTQCHVNAMHDATPVIPGAASCTFCHKLPQFAVQNCFGCHPKPIYHVQNPNVPGCNSHHGPFQVHDGLSSCESCHTNPASGHHRGSVVIPDCRSCHEDKQFHVGRISCQRCHRGAAHDNTPLNLPTPVWDVCLQCHPFASKAPACNECHDETQHSATYRVPDDCNACHDMKLHAGKVECRLCHTRIESGHHDDGQVEARDCSYCHVTAEVHAARTPGGADFGCDTCHEGGPHGTLSLPGTDRCLECHEQAEEHRNGFECIQCHWPAAHDATPIAGQFGSYERLALRLPAPTGVEEVDERAEFTFTGFDLIPQLALGLGLLLMGVVLRALSSADAGPSRPRGPGGSAD